MNNPDITNIIVSIATLTAAFPFVVLAYSIIISLGIGIIIGFVINKFRKKYVPVPGVKCSRCKEKGKIMYVAIGERCPDCKKLCL